MKRRSGFTLIELLVVIAIIAILAGLLLAAVMVFLRKGPETVTRNDMTALAQGLQTFKTKYGQYPPDTIRLRANLNDYNPNLNAAADALDARTVSFLRSVMWKNLPTGNTNIPWAGPNTDFNATYPSGVILEGDQSLMFFLLGPPNAAGNASAGFMGGFNNDPQNPVGATPTPLRFMDIPNAGRLVNRATSLFPNGHPFPSYVDGYGGAPYMYFSSTDFLKRPNGYHTFANSLGIKPYAKDAALTQFYNPDSFQLISAGADGILSSTSPPPTYMPTAQGGFGPGGMWTPGGGMGTIGGDDVSNFYDKKLGIQ